MGSSTYYITQKRQFSTIVKESQRSGDRGVFGYGEIRRNKKQIDKDCDVLNSHLLQQMREKMNKENLRANE